MQRKSSWQEKQLSGLQDMLQKRNAKITELQIGLRTQKKNTEESLRSAMATLEAKSHRLDELESYTSKLEPVLPRNMYVYLCYVLYPTTISAEN